MKKIIAIAAIITLACVIFTGCNESEVNYFADYKTATIKYPNGEVITVSVESYKPHETSVEIKTYDGTIYYTSWQNVILIGE